MEIFISYSLGISMLEIACDLELPSGDNNWHRLRDGVLPHDFTKGKDNYTSTHYLTFFMTRSLSTTN